MDHVEGADRAGVCGRVYKLVKYLLRDVIPFWFFRLITDWLPECHHTQRLRGIICRVLFHSCGKGLRMGSHVTVTYPSRVRLGRNVLLVSTTWIDSGGGVDIGDEVLVAPGCVITSTSHSFAGGSASRGALLMAPTKIGRGVWLAAHVVVSAGVVIGDGVLVGANAVVTRNLPENVIAGGVPARVIRPRVEDENMELR